MWKLTIEDDQANKTVVHLVREDYGIGRSEENAIRLTERNISRRHARLERNEEHWALKDLSSYNGCYVNGHRVGSNQDLNHGDLIQVGDYRLIVEDEALLGEHDTSATVPVVPRTSIASPGLDRLVVLAGPQAGSEFVLTQERMVIGRGEDCDISINHPSVSRVHAELHPLGDGRYEIFDKNSANGVRVNGVELPRSFVEPRDVVELGDVILKFVPAGELYIPGADESLQIAAIGAARRQEAEEGQLGRFAGPAGTKLGIGIGAMVAVLAVVFVATRPSGRKLELENVKDEAAERANRVLAEAKQLKMRDPRAAYRKAAELPQGASARESADFKAIQAAYADHLFELSEQAQDPSDKRALLDEIARSPTVDSARRKRAASALAQLSADAVDVSELPKTPPKMPPPTLAADAAAPAPSTSDPGKGGASSARPAPTSKAPPKSNTTTLVRENPFDGSNR
jgi:pSer/pThr/pTyr-binding forkhead associated (FHA) protein